MATRVDTAKDTTQEAQEQYFRVTDQVPEEVWYWAALGSIIVSASLFLMGKRDWSIESIRGYIEGVILYITI